MGPQIRPLARLTVLSGRSLWKQQKQEGRSHPVSLYFLPWHRSENPHVTQPDTQVYWRWVEDSRASLGVEGLEGNRVEMDGHTLGEWYAILDDGDVGCLTWSNVGGQSEASKQRFRTVRVVGWVKVVMYHESWLGGLCGVEDVGQMRQSIGKGALGSGCYPETGKGVMVIGPEMRRHHTRDL